MNTASAKDHLHARATAIDDNQFETLCKIIVEEVESPRNIEQTPFGGDGGIDLRGTFGKSFFDPKFGVQVKQYSSNVGKPDMRDFTGALHQHNYKFGCFITSSDFVSDIQKPIRDQSIVLVNGDKLTDIMVAHGLGVTYDGFDYEPDPDFWSIFEEPDESDLVPTIKVPQADNFEVLHIALEAIQNGYRFKPQIKQQLIDNTDQDDWASRQANYYADAAYALGYVHKDTMGEYEGQEMRQWGLTQAGTEYVALIANNETDEARKHLIEHIEESDIIERILPPLEQQGTLTRDELVDIIKSQSELTRSTPGRRASTVGNWLEMLPQVRRGRDGNRTVFEYVTSSLSDYA